MRIVRVLFTLAAALSLIFIVDNACANGGPVGWTGVTPVGAFGLVEDNDIVLNNEYLTIDITGFNTYKVRAVYELQNDGADKSVTYGVPVTWADMDPDDPWNDKIDSAVITAKARKQALKIQDTLSIKLNGQDIHCSLSDSAFNKTTQLKFAGADYLRAHINTDKAEEFNNLIEEDNIDKAYEIKTWCVATLTFKSKSTNNLILEYSGELFYTDMEFSKSSLTTFGTRQLSYLFYPAGYWKGTAKTININVNTGPYPSFKVFSGPSGSKIKGRTVAWLMKNTDLKTLPRLIMLFSAEPVAKNELLTWNKLPDTNWCKIAMKVKASSTLPAYGKIRYDAENVLDGKGETAWCKGKSSKGIGQWLQFNITDKKVQSKSSEKVAMESTEGSQNYQCRIEGLMFTPGYLKSQKSYEANAKIRRVTMTDCDGNHQFDISIDPPKDNELAPYFLSEHEASPSFESIKKTGCFRLTIQKVEKGTSDDVCVSEVALIRHCY